jgi:hypothetical protein
MKTNLWRMAVGLTASLVVGGTALVLAAPAALAAPPVTSAIPVPGLAANCPSGTNSVGQGGPAPVGGGVTATGASGTCTLELAKATVGKADFGANTILSATSMCTVGNSGGPPTSSAFYGGATITATTTIVTPDGYTLNFNVPVTDPATGNSGRIAVQIVKGGTVINLAETLCSGASYPLSAHLNTDSGPALSPVSTGGHSGTSSALLLLVGALVAFVVVNLTVVRGYRRRHNGSTA